MIRGLTISLIISLALLLCSNNGELVNDYAMLTEGLVLRLNQGGSIQLACEFRANNFNLFDNPILWRKTQRNEQTQINMMGNLLEPFASVGRFGVAFASNGGHHTLWLNIKGLSAEDNGNYTCEVLGPHNVVFVEVTHSIAVGDAIDIILLTNKNTTPPLDASPGRAHLTTPASFPIASVSLTSPFVDDDVMLAPPLSNDELQDDVGREGRRRRGGLVYIEDKPGTLRCLTVGSSASPPVLRMLIGRRDVTSEFRSSVQLVTARGPVGMRLLRYAVELWRHDFRPNHEDGGKRINCEAYLPPPNEAMTSSSSLGIAGNTSSRLIVNYSPKIICESTQASLNEVSVYVRCDISARPPPSNIYWIVDSNGTSVTEGDSVGDYHVLILEHTNGMFETQLYVRRVNEQHFRTYEIVAQNSIATRRQTVELKEKIPDMRSLNTIQQQQHQIITTRSAAPPSLNKYDDSDDDSRGAMSRQTSIASGATVASGNKFGGIFFGDLASFIFKCFLSHRLIVGIILATYRVGPHYFVCSSELIVVAASCIAVTWLRTAEN